MLAYLFNGGAGRRNAGFDELCFDPYYIHGEGKFERYMLLIDPSRRLDIPILSV